LLGELVRHDGAHKKHRIVVGKLARLVDLVAVCPEVELGLGVPRETLRLVRRGGSVSLHEPATDRDRTAAMNRFAAARVQALERDGICGYVFKRKSPSCGLHHVRTVGSDGRRSTDAVGLFAAALRARMPLLPVIEEFGLDDPQARDRFITCVFGYARLRAFFGARWSRTGLLAFHADEKLALARRSQAGERRLAGLLTEAPSLSRAELRAAYSSKFMQVLSRTTR
jgi:uncharacterized protein YbbK (DUF523 family)